MISARVVAACWTVIGTLTLAASASGQTWTGGPTGPIYYSGGNVGVGTTSPFRTLSVSSTSVVAAEFKTYGNIGIVDFGPAVPNAVSFVRFYSTTYNGWSLGADGGNGEQFRIARRMDATLNSPSLVIDTIGNVGIGTSNPTSRLSVTGTIQAKEVIVNTGWADYVFSPNYRLKPLREVAAYIQQNHHLPEIPSEAEVKEKRVGIGDMQAKLLAKIEELTLHMIQAEDRNDRLEEGNRKLQGQGRAIFEENRVLQERIGRLEQVANSTWVGKAVRQ